MNNYSSNGCVASVASLFVNLLVCGSCSIRADVLTGLGGQASARDGHAGNLGQFEARLLRLLAPSSNTAGGAPAVTGTGSSTPTAPSPDPAVINAAAALDPLATTNNLGLFCCLFIEFHSVWQHSGREILY